MILDKDVYCNIPYSSVVINPDGSYRLCTLTNSQKHDMGGCKDVATGQEMSVWTHSFEDALNSKWHSYLRAKHVCDEKSSLCECCYNRDAIQGNSRRTFLMKLLPENIPEFPTPENSDELTSGSGRFMGPIRSLDLRFGNLCNYKCVTCGPWYSDKWYEEYQAFNEKDHFPWNGKIIKITGERLGTGMVGDRDVPWWESDIWWKRFDNALPTLRHIYFTGGEPMLIKSHVTMLERIVEAGIANEFVIELDTNLSALNDRILNLWPHFKRVELRISLDDVGSKYEVMRFPGQWDIFDDNVAKIVQRKMPNVELLLTSCITPLNVFDVFDIEQYSKIRLGKDAHFRFVDTPGYLDLRVFNTNQKNAMIDYLDQYTRSHSKWSHRVVSYLRSSPARMENPDKANRFFAFMDYLDGTRNTNWRALFPKAAALQFM
jgi:organic radical activating enzyme